MTHYEARMSSKGQVTIPSKVRESLELKEGDLVDFYIDDRRSVRIIARNKKLADLRGILGRYKDQIPTSLDEVDRAVGSYLGEKHDRISREWNEWQEFLDWKRTRHPSAAE